MFCVDLQETCPVVFRYKPEHLSEKIYIFGSVFLVNKEKRTVCVRYLNGPKSKYVHIPFEDMVAAYDKEAPLRRFGHISGNCVLLEDDEKKGE